MLCFQSAPSASLADSATFMITKTSPEIFLVVKMKIFSRKQKSFLIFVQNVDCGRGDSNEYPQSLFWIKSKKNRYTPVIPSFSTLNKGSRGILFTDMFS